MIILLAILIILTAGIVYLTCTPISFEINFNIDSRKLEKGEIRMFPFYYKMKMKPEEKGKKKEKREKPKTKKAKARKIDVMQVVHDEVFVIKQILFSSLKFLIGVVKTPGYNLRISLNGGMPSPDLTAYLYGGVCAAKPFLGESLSINYAPNFEESTLGGEISGKMVVSAGSFIKQLLLFLWRLPKFRILKIYFKIKKGGKNVR